LTAAHAFLLLLRAALSSAFSSACAAKPHRGHRNDSCDCRLAFSPCPQAEQVRLVFLGSPRRTDTPACAAVSVMDGRTWQNAQERRA
jgi:hypothetical protein